ncbi:MAG: glycosyltransferase family 4 protein [Woeseiaceae bacterium]
MKIVHISAWAKTFTQFRMPMLWALNDIVESQLIYCPDRDAHFDRLKENGFEVVTGPVSKGMTLSVLGEIRQLTRFLKNESFDVLIAHQPMAALIGIIAARRANVAVKIYSTGGLKYVPDQDGISNTLMRIGEVKLINWSDAVLLVNKEDEKTLSGLSVDPRRVHIVGPRGGCGLDTDVFNPREREEYYTHSREQLGLEPDHQVVGFVGRCVWEKGLRELAEAAVILSKDPVLQNLRYCILGNGGDLDEFRELVETLGVSKFFVFPGYLPAIHEFVAAFDVFILPSYREGLPISLLEAQAMGIPSVTTDVRGSRELVEDGKTGLLIECRNPTAIATALRQMIEDPEMAQRLANAAVTNIRDNYSEAALLPRTMQILQETIERGLAKSLTA